MESKINLAREKLKTFPLKDKQIDTLQALQLGNGCVSILPTGYGKSYSNAAMSPYKRGNWDCYWCLPTDFNHAGSSDGS